MALILEIGVAQLNKFGEELCGDSVATAGGEAGRIVVLADGLGSGVKANILSSLTSRLAAGMLEGGCAVDEVIESLAQTLPVCEVRGLAYSTFSIIQHLAGDRVYLAEYDNPPAFFLRQGELRHISFREREVAARNIREAVLDLQAGDWIILVSDGVIHAGIGGVWNLGWDWTRIANYLRTTVPAMTSAQEAADDLCSVTHKLYAGRPGDDATVVAVRVRDLRRLTVLVGPPSDPARDEEVVARLLGSAGRKVVCGGTSGNIVARKIGAPVEVDLGSIHDSVPPMGRLEGLDLVTEGILTLSRALAMLKEEGAAAGTRGRDGASLLCAELLAADHILFLLGQSINPAHQSPELPVSLALKPHVVGEIAQILTGMGKRVEMEYY